jgi:hypothetical protein
MGKFDRRHSQKSKRGDAQRKKKARAKRKKLAKKPAVVRTTKKPSKRQPAAPTA